MKYTKEFKLECVKKYKLGEYINSPIGCERATLMKRVREWNKIYDAVGESGLEHIKPRKTFQDKFNMIQRVINGESITEVACSNGLRPTSLSNWYKKYREFGLDGLKLDRRGRPTKMVKKPKRSNGTTTIEELEKENEYLRAEIEVLKKLSALVQKRMDQQQKKK